MVRNIFSASIAGLLVLVNCSRAESDVCDRPQAWITDFGTPAICRAVRKKQVEGCTLAECVRQDGRTFCIVSCPKAPLAKSEAV